MNMVDMSQRDDPYDIAVRFGTSWALLQAKEMPKFLVSEVTGEGLQIDCL